MRNWPNFKAEKYRITTGPLASDPTFGGNGYFEMPTPDKSSTLKVVASDGEGWDHVSVSGWGLIPTWEEMCYVKDIFFCDEEVVVQFHPKKSEYVNFHPHCLHLWRKQDYEFPTPPSILVGPKTAKALAEQKG